jgi:hypothetical protein
MNLIAILSWYRESPIWLAALTASLSKARVDHLVAVDGPYFLYPRAVEQPRSTPEEIEALTTTATATNIGITIHQRNYPWMGNEIEKRSYAFHLAEQTATPMEDWYLVVDGDDLITHTPPDIKAQLEATELHAAHTTLWWEDDPHANPNLEHIAQQFDYPQPNHTTHWNLFRAIPGLHTEGAHMINVAHLNGEKIYLRCGGPHQTPTIDLTNMRIQHRHNQRPINRKRQAHEYYELRDLVGAEDTTLNQHAEATT